MSISEDTTMTTTIAPTVGTVTVRGKGALTGLLADLALTAATETVLPVFTRIRLHTEGGRLHGWSCDRFRMGHAAVDAVGELPDVVYLNVADVKRIVSTFRLSPSLTVQVDTRAHRIDFGDGSNSASFTLPDVDGQRLDFLAHVANNEVPVESAPVSYSGKYLEEFGKIGKRRACTVTIVGAIDKKPSHVKIGTDYRAWLMPMNADESPWLPTVF